ncbi:hypothetical protein ABZ960_39790 [Streptomyces pseudovenezuelae]
MGEIKYDIVPTGGEGRGELRGRPLPTGGKRSCPRPGRGLT